MHLLLILRMMCYDRIDLSEGIATSKNKHSKDCLKIEN